MFKITLPCSGKVTDETDVQVLINVSGQVLVDEEPQQAAGLFSELQDELPAAAAPRASSQAVGAAAPADNSTTPSGSTGTTTQEPQAATGAMQADEPQPRRTKFVSHTLAIKRKKICTMHPVPAPVPNVHPATQPRAQVLPPPPPSPPLQLAQPAQPQPLPGRLDRWPLNETVSYAAFVLSKHLRSFWAPINKNYEGERCSQRRTRRLAQQRRQLLRLPASAFD